MNRPSAHVSVSRLSPASLAAVTLAHAGLLGLLLAHAAPEPITPPRPLMVSLLTPTVETPQPQPKPEPKPQPPKPVTKPLPTPVLAAKPTPAPIPQTVAAPPEPMALPQPVTEQLPPPAPVAEAPKPAPTPPRPADNLNNPKPPYPSLSKRLGEEGTVRLYILVNPDGSVARLELEKSSGHPRLDRAAIDTVQSSWKFEPARQGSTPVAAWVIVPIQFTLRS
ncbi:MAG: energy transducer TonB [Rubrivivax sp.]|nr:energy transducer TonB [Rubrivivax sp.]